jgi:hypothetical protein
MYDLSHEDERASAVLAQLATMELTPIVGQYFADQAVFLDGRSFRVCRFLRCKFYARLGWYEIIGPTPMSDCGMLLEKPAIGAHNLYEGLANSRRGVIDTFGRRPTRPD